MICPTCFGKGKKLEVRRGEHYKQLALAPCPTCHGQRFLHCGEGDRAQPRGSPDDNYYERDPDYCGREE